MIIQIDGDIRNSKSFIDQFYGLLVALVFFFSRYDSDAMISTYTDLYKLCPVIESVSCNSQITIMAHVSLTDIFRIG